MLKEFAFNAPQMYAITVVPSLIYVDFGIASGNRKIHLASLLTLGNLFSIFQKETDFVFSEFPILKNKNNVNTMEFSRLHLEVNTSF